MYKLLVSILFVFLIVGCDLSYTHETTVQDCLNYYTTMYPLSEDSIIQAGEHTLESVIINPDIEVNRYYNIYDYKDRIICEISLGNFKKVGWVCYRAVHYSYQD